MAALARSTVAKVVLLVVMALGLSGIGWWLWRVIPPKPSEFHLRGKFGPVSQWPLIPLEVITLPDGRVMSYGTDGKGKQTGETIYDVWDPARGMGVDSHLTLPNSTGTDIFCSGALIVPESGAVLVVGGDRTVGGERNWSSPSINYFDYKKNNLSAGGRTMERARWYPTVVTLPNGEILVAGGRLDPEHYAPLPEVYSPKTGWRTLTAAESDDAYGSPNWNYPRLWVAPNGRIFNITRFGHTFYLDVAGQGKITPLKATLFRGHSYLPSIMFAPGKVLSLRLFGVASVVDFSEDGEPKVTRTDWYSPLRMNASATVLPDGQVFLSGGSLRNNDGRSEILANRLAEIWNPDTGHWTAAAVAQKERLYHSTALLMQDGTVLTGGGGAGYSKAENNLNVEVYYPPYLFKKDGSGQMAARPTITLAPDFIQWAQPFDVGVSSEATRMTLVKLSSVTHTQVFDQRFLNIEFSKKGGAYQAIGPLNHNLAPPGYYFLFVFDKAGVPSVAKIVKLID